MQNGLLSVIVPVYQAERYLAECLDSILRQTYHNLEVIAVDDGSTDGSADILREYAARDARIRVCRHAENMGLLRARVTGIKAAGGAYIGFVDSDDVIASDYFRPMLALAESSAADMVTATTVYQAETGERYVYNRCDRFRLADIDAQSPFAAFWGMTGANMELHTVWNKLYTRRLLNRCLPWLEKLDEHIVMAEDVAFSCITFFYTQKTAHMPYSYYFYRQHPAAATGAHSVQRCAGDVEDIARVFSFLASFLHTNGMDTDGFTQLTDWKKRFSRIWRGKIQAAAFPERDKRRLVRLLRDGLGVETGYEPEDTDTFFYVLRTAWDSRYYEITERIAADDVQVVSFDVFDTLLVRPFLQPSDLFFFLQEAFGRITGNRVLEYAAVRTRCERVCWNQYAGKVTLRDIYREIGQALALSADQTERLMCEEFTLERRFCRARESARNFVQLAAACGKQIVCVSDMYLSGVQIQELLDSAGYGQITAVFASSDYGCTKADGLFGKVLRAIAVPPGQVLHIGDSRARDVAAAERSGLQACWYPAVSDCLFGQADAAYTGRVLQPFLAPDGSMVNLQSALHFHGVRCMLGVAANKLFDCPFLSFDPESDWNSDPEMMGYFALGMHLFALTQWIAAHSRGKARAVFAARDGWLPMQAYLLARARCAALPEAVYLPVSRKAVLPCLFSCARDVYLLPEAVQLQAMTPHEVLTLLAPILREDAADYCAQHGVRLQQRLAAKSDCDVFLQVLQACFDAPRAQAWHAQAGRYFAPRCPENSVLFDIGYSGRGAWAVSAVTGHSFQTLYLHINADTPLRMERAGALSLACFYEQSPCVTGVGREALFSAREPSCVGYAPNANGYVSPVFEAENRCLLADYAVNAVQAAATAFVRDMLACFGDFANQLAYRRADASAPWELLLQRLPKRDLELFSLTPFEDALFAGVASVPLSKAWGDELTARQSGVQTDTARRYPADLEEIYADGVWMAVYRRINRLFPKGSRRRESVKRLFGFLK